jgi:hypothetical protein
VVVQKLKGVFDSLDVEDDYLVITDRDVLVFLRKGFLLRIVDCSVPS